MGRFGPGEAVKHNIIGVSVVSANNKLSIKRNKSRFSKTKRYIWLLREVIIRWQRAEISAFMGGVTVSTVRRVWEIFWKQTLLVFAISISWTMRRDKSQLLVFQRFSRDMNRLWLQIMIISYSWLLAVTIRWFWLNQVQFMLSGMARRGN